MFDKQDHATRDLARATLKLHAELVFTPQKHGKKCFYHVEVPSQSKFYRIGIREYTFLSLFDGKTTVAEAISLTARTLGNDSLTEHEAEAVCSWMIESEMATVGGQSTTLSANRFEEKRSKQQWAQKLNPIYIKLSLFNPDRLLDRIVPWFGWIHSPLAMAAWLVVLIAGGYSIAANWNRFAASSQGILASSNWIWLGASWVFLKLIHELSHGLASKRYRCEVRDFGVMLILFAPIAYVDVTSSWRLQSKWRRMHVAAAGMYIELWIAAVAAIAWSILRDEVIAHALYNLIFMASVSTLLFNANALMRFDGYYIFSDFVGIPNLYTHGSRYVASMWERIAFGIRPPVMEISGAAGVLVRVYGLAAFAWRILVTVSLIIAASLLFHGAGIIIAVLATVMWAGAPLLRFYRRIRERQLNRVTLMRGAAIMTGVVMIAVATLAVVPWPFAKQAPGVVEFDPTETIRAMSPGFVEQVFVKDGQVVEKGQQLAILKNDELQQEYTSLQLKIEESLTSHRIHINKGEIAAAQIEEANQQALRNQLAELQRRVDGLTVKARVAGTIMRRNLDTLIGTYLNECDEIISIGNLDRKRLRISIAQEDVEAFSVFVSQSVPVRIEGGMSVDGVLKRIEPRASTEPFHRALCASDGGPLPVSTNDNQTESLNSDQEDSIQFVEPRFVAIVELPTNSRDSRYVGAVGQIALHDPNESLGRGAMRLIKNWIDAQFEQSR